MKEIVFSQERFSFPILFRHGLYIDIWFSLFIILYFTCDRHNSAYLITLRSVSGGKNGTQLSWEINCTKKQQD